MIPVESTDKYYGCFSSAIASVLELPLDSLPAFTGEAGNFHDWWHATWEGWFRERGLVLYRMSSDFQAAGYSIGVLGKDDLRHCVVLLDGVIVHDPDAKNAPDPPWPLVEVAIIAPRDPSVLLP